MNSLITLVSSVAFFVFITLIFIDVSIKITAENGYHQLHMQCISGSKKMDEKRKSRSFQDHTKTYSETVQEVVKSNEGGDVICTKGKEDKIEEPIIQYEETDWKFIQRMASRQEAIVIVDIKENRPRIWFGMRKGKAVEEVFGEEVYEVVKEQISTTWRGYCENGIITSVFPE